MSAEYCGSPKRRRSNSEVMEDDTTYSVDSYLWKHNLQRKYYVYHPLSIQTGHITPNMRQTLLLWLSAVIRQFGYALETTCLTANFLDRFLSGRPLHRDCLQLAGLTSFFVAAKSEEIDPPEVSELVALSARSFTAAQFRWMERHLLDGLGWHLIAPTAAFFLDHLVEMERLGFCWPEEFSRHLVERCLADYELAQAAPANLAHAVFGVIAERFICDARIGNFTFSEQTAHNIDKQQPMSSVFPSSANEELTHEYLKRVTMTLQGQSRQQNELKRRYQEAHQFLHPVCH